MSDSSGLGTQPRREHELLSGAAIPIDEAGGSDDHDLSVRSGRVSGIEARHDHDGVKELETHLRKSASPRPGNEEHQRAEDYGSDHLFVTMLSRPPSGEPR
jgi:hypothetical protein